MDNATLGEVLRCVAGPQKDFHEKLMGAEGVSWLEEFNKFLRKEPTWIVSSVLGQIDSFQCPAIPEFSPAGEIRKGVAGIGWMSEEAKRFIAGLPIELAEPAALVRVHELTRVAKLQVIANEVGEANFLTAGQALAVIAAQSGGEVDVWNIIPIRGIDWVLYCYCHHGHRLWRLDAFPLSRACDWDAGPRVLSL